MIAGYVNSEKHNRLSKYTTGLGVIIHSILNEMGKLEEIDFFCSMVPVFKSIRENKYKIIANIGWISFYDIRQVYLLFKDAQIHFKKCSSFKKFMFIMLEYIYVCRLYRRLKKEKYDVVHIHSSSRFSFIASNLCEKMKIPYLITVHNYYGEKSAVKGYLEVKEYEKRILGKDRVYLSTVSTGVKERIERDYIDIYSRNQIRVILNGIKRQEEREGFDKDNNIFEQHGIDVKNKKIILCPGTLSERKNQIQIIKAFSMLSRAEKSQIIIIFMGEDAMKGKLQEEILENHLEEQLKYIGAVHKDKMEAYYRQADAVISASLNESFGLIFIEGFLYGIPSITYKDLDAISDLYDPKTMVIASERTDESLKKAIQDWYKTAWDRNFITHYSERYLIQSSVEQYMKYYNYILENNN